MSVNAVVNWLVYLNLVVGGLLIASILVTKLFAMYPFFLAYLLTDTVQRVLRILHSGNRGEDQLLYMAGDAVKLLLITLTVREVLRAAFDHYPSLAEFLKRTGGYLAVASTVVSLTLVELDRSVPWTVNHLLTHFFTLERTVYSTLLIYLLVVSVFMAWFPVRIRRNVAIFIGGFVAFFACQWAVLLLVNRAPRTVAGLNTVVLAVSLACMVTWIAAIRPRGDQVVIVTGIRWNATALDQLTRQLDGINAALARFVRTNPE